LHATEQYDFVNRREPENRNAATVGAAAPTLGAARIATTNIATAASRLAALHSVATAVAAVTLIAVPIVAVGHPATRVRTAAAGIGAAATRFAAGHATTNFAIHAIAATSAPASARRCANLAFPLGGDDLVDKAACADPIRPITLGVVALRLLRACVADRVGPRHGRGFAGGVANSRRVSGR
jgi:hypothetical protein